MNSFLSAMLYCSLLYFLFIIVSTASDTLTLNGSIMDGQTLVSRGNTFELGFFSPGKPMYRYLGIWYRNISVPTVVWVANGDFPLLDKSGVLNIGKDGNLILLNSTRGIIWSSGLSTMVNGTLAQLLDSGNLVLMESSSADSGNYLWQSFDSPSNTAIPGIKTGLNVRTGEEWYLRSWKDWDDPSPGDFTFKLDNPELPQLVIYNQDVKKFRLGPWNGVKFIGEIPTKIMNPILPSNMISSGDELYFLTRATSDTIIARAILNEAGLLQEFYWNEQTNQWVEILMLDKYKCGNYGICGFNALCRSQDSSICQCLQGFTPKVPQKWKSLDWSEGCVRVTNLSCGAEDKFLSLEQINLPDLSHYQMGYGMPFDECRSKCQNICSCTAFAILDIVGQESRCLHWFGDLIDLKKDNENESVLYIKVPASEIGFDSNSNKTGKKRVVVGVPAAAGVILLVLSCFSLWWKLRKNEKGWMLSMKKRAKEQGNSINLEDSECSSHEKDLDLPLSDFDAIKAITCDFADTQKIGQGGFGPVYKAHDLNELAFYVKLSLLLFLMMDCPTLNTMDEYSKLWSASYTKPRKPAKLHTGQEIAVKRLSKNSRQGLSEFKNEVILIAKLQHRNLVRLFGCCIQNEEQILIYEYLPNGSLDSYIFDPERGHLLNWQKRFDIILGIARGLVYLHRDSRLRIIHRDLKASNILLDVNLNPKISDFGIAKTFQGELAEGVTRRVVGTYGYMSPEYAIDGLFSIKSDVFSFGVLLLEIVSGNRNRGFSHPHHDLSLLGHAWNLLKEERTLELLDPSVSDSFSMSEVSRCIQIGLLCVQRLANDRPTMSSTLSMLDSENAVLSQPKEPGFYSERCITELSTYEAPITVLAPAVDTLTSNKFIKDGQTLVSNGKTFELGFFSPGNSSNRYLGIWYKNVPIQKVVWVANGETPLFDKFGVVTISNNGNLLVLNSTGCIIWSSNLSIWVNNAIAQLLDSGNFVLMESSSANSDYLWQSFDDVSNTIIPGKKFGFDLKTGKEWYIRSWKSVDDPSPGDFTYKLENPELPQAILWQKDVKRSRIGPWDGVRMKGAAPYAMTPVLQPTLVSSGNQVYLMTRTVSESIIATFSLNEFGILQELYWKELIGQWVDILMVQNWTCGNYNMCGSNAVCNGDDSSTCQCLKGYTPKEPEKWKAMNWSDGCVRDTALACEWEDKFLKLTDVGYPDLVNYWIDKSMSYDECQLKCQNNCTCTAFAGSDITDVGIGCVLWFEDLLDLKKDSSDGLVLYVKVPVSKLAIAYVKGSSGGFKTKGKRSLLVGGSTVVSMLIMVSFFWFITRKGKSKKKGGNQMIRDGSQINESEITRFNIAQSEERSYWEDLELPLFDFETIKAATSDFADAHKIGQGGYGPVYKAQLQRGESVAVKRLSKDSRQGLSEFKNEFILISKLQHRNLVRLLGCCIENEEQMLIYDGYMSPEYAIDGLFSIKSDVFSFGVLVLEIVSGKRNRGFSHPDHDLSLLGHAWNLSNEGRALELMDPLMGISFSTSEVLRFIQVGLLCVQRHPKDRPTMSSALLMLDTEKIMLPEPKEPGFLSERSLGDYSSRYEAAITPNEILVAETRAEKTACLYAFLSVLDAWNLLNEGRALELMDSLMKRVLVCIRSFELAMLAILRNDNHKWNWIFKERSFLKYVGSGIAFINLSRSISKMKALISVRATIVVKTSQNSLETALDEGKSQGFQLVSKTHKHAPLNLRFLYNSSISPFTNLSKHLLAHLLLSSLAVVDTLGHNQTLTDGETLVSSGNIFTLGFFSPGNSTYRYVGIWYANVPIQTVIWVANNQNPMNDRSGVLKIAEDGNLVIVNQYRTCLVFKYFKAGNDTSVQMLDSAGMKQGLNLKTGQQWYIQSWKSLNDPSPGDYTDKLENPEFPQLIIRNGDVKHYRIGPWNGIRFIYGGISLKTGKIFSPALYSDENEVYIVVKTSSQSITARVILNEIGVPQDYYWNQQMGQWTDVLMMQQEVCKRYNICGNNAVCDSTASTICRCLKGFTPKVPQKWLLQDWSDGCVRQTVMNCEKEYTLLKLTNEVNLPDLLHYSVNSSMNLQECQAMCLSNCSCSAFSNLQIIGEGSGCALWFGDLVDMRADTDDGVVLYLKLLPSQIDSGGGSNKKRRIIIAVTTSVVLAILVLVPLGCTSGSPPDCFDKLWFRKLKVLLCESMFTFQELGHEEDLGLPMYDLFTIKAITANFANSQKIGEGGFGPVYKAQLATGQEIAIKRLSRNSRQGLNEFKNEATLIAKLQHRNLVRLLDAAHGSLLNWEKRYDIILGIARGLLYLHRDSRLRLIHRDLKASNVLLDNELNPKISDFGMARTFQGEPVEDKTRRVIENHLTMLCSGYMSPEYAIDGLFSIKSDVFSFGVLLLEIAWNLLNEGKELELVDPMMEAEYAKSQVSRCIQVGLLCVQRHPKDRPTMSAALSMLDTEDILLPHPKEPGFYTERSLHKFSSASDAPLVSNEMTVTWIESR
ncbi:Bulb-type lectin domain [Dillenia turbinata]|uniref:non-specific serine/threonine protein kinase n=1 Tax=Dillenia turbinata TaxID=194707 RepID=A0AAN8ZE20_9MAGN